MQAAQPDVAAAFEQTAKALQQFGLERVRVEGLSSGYGVDENGVRSLTEQQFMREFVFHLRPCIIVDAIESWPAMKKWRDDRYLFNLDHHLPLAEQSDVDEEEEEEGKELKKPLSGLYERRVTVALTPNGRADAVTHVVYDQRDVPEEYSGAMFSEESRKNAVSLRSHPAWRSAASPDSSLLAEKLFLSAAEVKLTLPEFYTLLQENSYDSDLPATHIDMREYKKNSFRSVIAYGQLQNNCFNTEYTHLKEDVVPSLEKFGERIFGGPPEAGNVWLGTGVSVSSMHQDWVENLYAVLRGVKEFVLVPPWEGIFIPKPEIPSAAFALDVTRCRREELKFAFLPFPKKDGELIPWMDFELPPEVVEQSDEATVLELLNSAIDTCHEESTQKLPESMREKVPCRHANTIHPIVAHVHPGETLYLPAMWLHRVSQRPDEMDIRARAQARGNPASSPPLPLIAAVNYWFDMSYDNPAVVMLREFGLLL